VVGRCRGYRGCKRRGVGVRCCFCQAWFFADYLFVVFVISRLVFAGVVGECNLEVAVALVVIEIWFTDGRKD
jgi:hypothetical protein